MNGRQNNIVPTAMTRRQMLSTSVKVGAGLVTGGTLGSLLAACQPGSPPSVDTPAPGPAVGNTKPTSKTVRVAVWGGAIQEAERKYIFDPFSKETGIQVVLTGPPTPAKVKAMVDSGNIEWDLVEGGLSYVIGLGEQYFEPVDYSIWDRETLEGVPAIYREKCSTGFYVYSTNIGYNKDMFPSGKYPQTWADFWDTKTFPGRRTLAYGGGNDPELEFALLADGVPIDKLYPLDIDRALKKMLELKPLIAQWWSSGAQPGEMMIQKQVSCGSIWVGRVAALAQQGAPIGMTFNQGRLYAAHWVIPKGAANATNAQRLLAYSLRADVQAAVWGNYVEGPCNSRAYDKMNPEYAKTLPTYPDNARLHFLRDERWWGENRVKVIEKFQTMAL